MIGAVSILKDSVLLNILKIKLHVMELGRNLNNRRRRSMRLFLIT